jgi:hypothetical protein
MRSFNFQTLKIFITDKRDKLMKLFEARLFNFRVTLNVLERMN